VPGCSGNPAGKKPGTENRATRLRRLLEEGEFETVGRGIIDDALAGKSVERRFLMDRLDPKPRHAVVELPPDCEGGSLAARCQSLYAAAVRGELAPAEAAELGRLLEVERKVAHETRAALKDVYDAEDRVAAERARTAAAAREAAAREAEHEAEMQRAAREGEQVAAMRDVLADAEAHIDRLAARVRELEAAQRDWEREREAAAAGPEREAATETAPEPEDALHSSSISRAEQAPPVPVSAPVATPPAPPPQAGVPPALRSQLTKSRKTYWLGSPKSRRKARQLRRKEEEAAQAAQVAAAQHAAALRFVRPQPPPAPTAPAPAVASAPAPRPPAPLPDSAFNPPFRRRRSPPGGG
jgi:hypothetical protein